MSQTSQTNEYDVSELRKIFKNAGIKCPEQTNGKISQEDYEAYVILLLKTLNELLNTVVLPFQTDFLLNFGTFFQTKDFEATLKICLVTEKLLKEDLTKLDSTTIFSEFNDIMKKIKNKYDSTHTYIDIYLSSLVEDGQRNNRLPGLTKENLQAYVEEAKNRVSSLLPLAEKEFKLLQVNVYNLLRENPWGKFDDIDKNMRLAYQRLEDLEQKIQNDMKNYQLCQEERISFNEITKKPESQMQK